MGLTTNAGVIKFTVNGAERMRINNDGTTNINGTLTINSNTINNYLFNNTGGTHGDITDFNAISTAGYKFVQGTTNGPNTGGGQYYSWLIGLGSNYALTGTGYTYSAQFALPRNITNPALSVRFNESGSWSGWSGITAAALT